MKWFNFLSDASVKYQTLPNIKNLEDTVFEIKHSLYDLEALLVKNDANEDDFMRFIKCKELLSENMYLKQKVSSLEEELDGKNQRIKMLEKLVLETHLWCNKSKNNQFIDFLLILHWLWQTKCLIVSWRIPECKDYWFLWKFESQILHNFFHLLVFWRLRNHKQNPYFQQSSCKIITIISWLTFI